MTDRDYEYEWTEEGSVTRHEEEISRIDTTWRGIGHAAARKKVETIRVKEDVPREVERVSLERAPVETDDSGKIERLPDGSISIPVFEEELVVERRTVLKERVIIRKEIVTEVQRIEADLRKEHVEIEADEGVDLDVDR